MFEVFKRHSRPKSLSLIEKKILLLRHFINDDNHHWIKSSPHIKKAMVILIDEMNEKHVEFFLTHKTFLINCHAHLSCAIGSTKNHHLILVFPELLTLLKSSSFLQGLAVLAHELGHIYYQHTEKKVDSLKAQIEADDFAFELGFGDELKQVLLEHVHINADCRVRVAHLSKKL